jgi:hypothetical protein
MSAREQSAETFGQGGAEATIRVKQDPARNFLRICNFSIHRNTFSKKFV